MKIFDRVILVAIVIDGLAIGVAAVGLIVLLAMR